MMLREIVPSTIAVGVPAADATGVRGAATFGW